MVLSSVSTVEKIPNTNIVPEKHLLTFRGMLTILTYFPCMLAILTFSGYCRQTEVLEYKKQRNLRSNIQLRAGAFGGVRSKVAKSLA